MYIDQDPYLETPRNPEIYDYGNDRNAIIGNICIGNYDNINGQIVQERVVPIVLRCIISRCTNHRYTNSKDEAPASFMKTGMG